MKLYLSSYRIPSSEKLFELFDKNKNNIKTAIIPNAKDYYADRARNVKINDTKNYLISLGLSSDLVDLRKYTNGGQLAIKLEEYDFLWVMGGNTFCLRYEMQRSGFDQIINDLLKKGVVYGGESAGACVAGSTIKGVETADNPYFAEDILWDGLNIIPNIILPHTDNPSFASDIEHARSLHKDNPLLTELTDSQAYVMNGETQTVIDGVRQ